jgi:hypothetical protein
LKVFRRNLQFSVPLSDRGDREKMRPTVGRHHHWFARREPEKRYRMYGTEREQYERDIEMEKQAIEDLKYKIAIHPFTAGWWFDDLAASENALRNLERNLARLPCDQP